MTATRTMLALTALLLAAGCGSKDPEQRLETIDSHAESARLLRGELHARHVSHRYAAVLARRLREAIDAEAQSAGKAKLSSPDQARIAAALAEARHAVALVAAEAGR